MATLTFYLKKRKGRDQHPLYLRVTHNRKSRLLHTDIYLDQSDWNKDKEKVRKSHPIAKRLNNHLTLKRLNAKKIILDLKEHQPEFTVKELKEAIIGNSVEKQDEKKEQEEEDEEPDFFEYATDVIKDYKTTLSYNRWKGFNTVYNKVEDFWGRDKLPFEAISPEFLRKYEVHYMKKRGNKPNTIKSNLKKVRKIFNDAIREGIVSRNIYPFDYYTMPSNPVIKPKLTAEEIKAFKSVKTKKGTRLFDSQKIFMFAYYCWGMRFGDVCSLQWSNIKGDRLIYIMEKTGKRMSIKITTQAKAILACYKPKEKRHNEHYIFPFLGPSKGLFG